MVCECVRGYYCPFWCRAAVRFGYNNVILEGDSLSVVSVIVSNVEGSSPIHHFYDCIADFSSCLLGFWCSFVRRNGNTLAHLLAKWKTRLANEKINTDPFPQGLLTLAELDL